jgi:FAD-dependent fumarate reductase
MPNHAFLFPLLSLLILYIAYLSSNILTPTPMPPSHAIIIGSGLAGLSTSSQLLSHRIPVILLDRSPKPGGNSIKASSGINGSPTPYQPVIEPQDAFYSDTVKSAGQALTPHHTSLITRLIQDSQSAVTWLVEKGVDLSKVAQLGGHSYARTHRGAGASPPGYAIISTLLSELKKDAFFDLRSSCTVTKILQSGPRVTGVQYTSADGQTHDLYGPVVFASGGYAGDPDGMLKTYRPDLAGYPSTNEPRPGMQHLLTAVGAQVVDMQHVQVHPTGFVDPADQTARVKFLAAEVLRGEGGVLLMSGKRFVNELDTRERVTARITADAPVQDTPRQWEVMVVLDEGVYAAAKAHVDFYMFKKLMRKATIAELGPDALEAIRRYADAAAGEREDEFGRRAFANWMLRDPVPESVVYVGMVTPVIHFTMGGVLIDEKSEVLDKDNKPIEGLWGAGEVTGGVHGGNRLGGSSLLECVVFGRIAGDQVAASLSKH